MSHRFFRYRVMLAGLSALFGVLAAGSPALAQSGNPDLDRIGRGRRYLYSLELGYSHFFPYQRIFESSYGNVNPGAVVRFGILAPRLVAQTFGQGHKDMGSLQFSLGAGYSYSERKNVSVLPDLKDRIHGIPLDLTVSYHARYSERQWLWPSFGVGPDFDIYINKVDLPSQPSLAGTTKGMKYGWHAEVQLNLSLNRFDRYAATTARRTGLHDTSIFARGRWRNASAPGGGRITDPVTGTTIRGEGIRFTGWVVDGGISFLFR
ncbi:MAG: hypothetical protein KIT79_05945 [Deltaproteobacteria bacterium]|nr:hypothetical protein [Deltaproteobacteria bacterium]